MEPRPGYGQCARCEGLLITLEVGGRESAERLKELWLDSTRRLGKTAKRVKNKREGKNTRRGGVLCSRETSSYDKVG